ncbi:AAA family ATPase [Metapseudomonas otitidis]|uniref:AAA family ATPase n=1 Tax=Metapseudomonas otitidis TaxID=319939 RepID=UPI0039FCA4D4
MKNDIHDLGLVLDSKVKLIVIESWDEQRVLETLTTLAVKRGMSLFTWSVTEGLQRLGFGGEPLGGEETVDPEKALRLIKSDLQSSLYVMCDLHPFLEDNPRLVRLLKEVAMADSPQRPTLVLVSHALRLPPEVQRYSARFTLALPSEDELLAIVREEATRWSERNRGARVRTDNRTLQQVVKNLRGLSHGEARSLARNVICDDGAITQEDLPELNKTKFQLLDLEGVLSFEYDTARFAEVGGLANLKRWLGERQGAFIDGDAEDRPKGMLLVGVQGGGKSLAAKAVAGLWGLPLLRLDFACLYNKFFGETERNLREALRLAEQMAPCVLWMDEIEKGLASGDHDGGVSQRVLGTLLTWMSERKAPVFMIATANAIHRLPPELVRKGRFDELFFVDLPDPATRAEIFRIHLSRRGMDLALFDLPALASASDGFSGAEIEHAVVGMYYAAQAAQSDVSQALLLQQLQGTAPLSVIMSEELAALRSWAASRCVRAD